MDAEIEKKLRGILDKHTDIIYELSTKNRNETALKEIAALVVGTIPAKLDKIPPHCETDLILAEGFNDCRTEMLSRWTNKEKL